VAACLSRTELAAQDATGQDRSAQPSPVLTLHVATNLVRIPVLVLTPQYERLYSPIAPNRFTIQFGSEPPIRPKYVRREGDDPIDVAFVLDTRWPQESLLPKIDEAIANLAPTYLRAGDRISIYATDCAQMHEVEDVSADRVHLKSAVDLALSSWSARERLRKKPPCRTGPYILSDLEYVTMKLAKQPGWRTIIAVTNGDDSKSKLSLEELISTAQIDQVTILGLDPFQAFHRGPLTTDRTARQFTGLCELSGGVLLDLYQSSVAKRMQQFMRMLRERYILEFPRPANLKAGRIPMIVRIDHSDAFICAAGDGVPVSDEVLASEAGPIVAPPPVAAQAENNPTVAAPATEAAPTVESAAQLPVAQKPAPAVPVAVSSPTAPATALPPATPAQTTAATPLFKTSVRLTVEDVTATDSKDKPVHGLAQPEFTVKEDGRTQPIVNFEEYGAERPAAQAAAPQLPPNVYTNALPPAPTTGAANIFMFDDVATGLSGGLKAHPEYLMYARQQALKYLKIMPTGTRIAILELTDRLRVVQDFTSDRAVLTAAIGSITLKPVPVAYYVPHPEAPHGSRPDPVLPGEVCSPANMQSALTVDALEQAAAFLAGVQGRKNLIWFTPGTPWLTTYPEFSRVPCLRDYTPELQRDYGLLTAAQVSLYPVDPRGLEACNSPDPHDTTFCMRWMSALGLDHHALQEMAQATGGAAYYNRNDLDAAVGEAIAAGADYYSLSYVPPLSKYDGQFHKINVKVNRPGVHLQYRDGYTSIDLAKPPKGPGTSAEKAATQPDEELHAAMGHGAAPSTQLLFDVRVAPSTSPPKPGDPQVMGSPAPALKGKPLVRYDFQFALRPEQVTLGSEANGKREGSVDLVMIAYDGEGNALSVLTNKASFAVWTDRLAQFLSRPLLLPLQFDLPPGNIFVRIGVRDLPSGNAGTLEIPVSVDKPQK
jgi:VWFA-related protein